MDCATLCWTSLGSWNTGRSVGVDCPECPRWVNHASAYDWLGEQEMGTICSANLLQSFSGHFLLSMYFSRHYYSRSSPNRNSKAPLNLARCLTFAFFLYRQTEGEGDDMVVTDIRPPGGIHQAICTIGRLIVLGGALWKGRSEFKEMSSVGVRKYFQTTVDWTKRCFRRWKLWLVFLLGLRSTGKLLILFVLRHYLHREYSAHSGHGSSSGCAGLCFDLWLGLHVVFRHGISTDRSIRCDDLRDAAQWCAPILHHLRGLSRWILADLFRALRLQR